MLDNKLLRRSPEQVAENLARRGYKLDLALYQKIDARRRTSQVEIESIHARRHQISEQLAGCSAEQRAELLKEASANKQRLAELEKNFPAIKDEEREFLLGLPNLLADDVPAGLDAKSNRLIRTSGDTPSFTFKPESHYHLFPHDMDFAGASRIVGARFVVLHNHLARLHRALIHWMLDQHVDQHGYRELYVPCIVEDRCLIGTGQLPKFANDLFRLHSDRPRYLIPTAEVPITNLMRDTILSADQLPLRYVAHTPCFRSEAGSYGKDTAGMIRQHQFEKVELVQICHPDDSQDALQQLIGHAESILQKLELPWRVMQLSAGDTGFASANTYDIEVWLPSLNCYREISSCSNFTDFQTRRAGIRFRDKPGMPVRLAHTINGSALAIGRTLIALIENRQQADGSITVPEVLQPYMNDRKVIPANTA